MCKVSSYILFAIIESPFMQFQQHRLQDKLTGSCVVLCCVSGWLWDQLKRR